MGSTSIPTGVISDKISKKFSIILSTITFTMHAIVYILIPTFSGFILTQILLACSAALASGTISAYIHDLVAENTDSTYTKVVGNLNFVRNIFSVVLVSISSYSFFFNNKSNFLLSTIMGIVGTFIAFRLPCPKKNNIKDQNININIDIKEYLLHITENVKYLSNHKWLLKLIFIHSINITFLIFNFDYYQILLKRIGFNMQYIGTFYASFFFWSGLGAKVTNCLANKLGHKNLTKLYMAMLSFSYLIIGESHFLPYIILAIIMQQLCFGSWNLLVEASVLDNASSSNAKAVLESLHNCLLNFIKAIIVLVLSAIVYIRDLNFAYIVLSVTVVFMMIFQSDDNYNKE